MAANLSAGNESAKHSHSGHGQHHKHKGEHESVASLKDWTGDSEAQMLRLLFNTHGPDATHDALSLKQMDDMLADLGIPEGKRDHVEEHLLKKSKVRGQVAFAELAHYWKDHGHKDDAKALGAHDKRHSILHFFESVRHFSQKHKVASFDAAKIAAFLVTYGFGEKEAGQHAKELMPRLGWNLEETHSYAEFCQALAQNKKLVVELEKHVPEQQEAPKKAA